MTDVAADLAYLAENAFECSIEINPGAVYHDPLPERFAFQRTGGGIACPDWPSEKVRARALETGKYVTGQVYPRGSVSFYQIAGDDVGQVVAELARLCREDLGQNSGKIEHPGNTP